MKILYGITKANFGGAQRYVFELAQAAKAQGFEVSVLCGQDGTLANKLKEKSIRTINLGSMQRDISATGDVGSFFKIYKVLKKERPDVFHINSSKMGGLGTLAARLAGVKKIIFTAHGWAFNEPRPFWQKWLIKFFAWMTVLFSHKTICVSEKTKEQIAGWPFISRKLIVIHNGIDTFPLLPRKDDSLTVGTIAELHKIKGLDILLKAWNKFTKSHKAQLVIIGEGEERENLGELIKELGIEKTVTLKGFVTNAREHLSDFDIFVMPSRSEAMPYALLEAGVAKLPVIATPVGGIPEVIESGTDGVLVPVEDVEALFSTLVLLTNDPELKKRLGHSLSLRIAEEFSFEKMVDKTFGLYREV